MLGCVLFVLRRVVALQCIVSQFVLLCCVMSNYCDVVLCVWGFVLISVMLCCVVVCSVVMGGVVCVVCGVL